MRELTLTAAQRHQLEQQLRETRDAGVYRRTLAVLEAGAGRSITEIARLLRTSRPTVYHWIECYQDDRDPHRLLDHRGGNHPTGWTAERQALLEASLARPPDHFGYPAVEWTVPLLRAHLAHSGTEPLSATSIRRQLWALGYVWKRPRYVLAPDQEREKKSADSARNRASVAAHGETVRR
jgi:transposase